MAFEDDLYRDDDGEPLMDYDDIQSEDDEQPQLPPIDDDVPDFNDEEDEENGNWSQEPKTKTRKRLIKKSDDQASVPPEFNDFADEDDGVEPEYGSFPDDEEEEEPSSSMISKKRKDKGMMREGGEKRRKEKKLRRYKFGSGGGSSGGVRDHSKAKLSLRRKKGGGDEGDPEMQEMWDTIAGGNSEDDQEGMKTLDDDNFIDDTGVDPADRYVSDREAASPSRFAQAEEGEEEDMFKSGKKKKKNEKSAAEIAELVETLMAELEVVAEEDAVLNTQGKPAINKLRKLPLLTEALSKKQLQLEFLDHGVLTLLKNWLEPLPDGSLPNINIREAILRILTDYPIDLDQHDRKEQLKKSGLGKVIMFLSRSEEETTSNRKLAKDLVDKWSRPIFNKSTRFEDMRNVEDERVFRRPSVKKPANKASGMESRDDDLDEFSSGRKAGPSASMLHASRPEATPMDFVIRPQSKIDPDEIRARAKQHQVDERRLKMNKKMQQLKQMKKKKLQATKVSVEGRGMVKYL
ncbi:protein IWS1 homolog 1-like [Chenopodium quinoa]|uniref:protein IWS1 homolog 1-like n=1 Tax=Chenopodium quinoa TaxID=63459 RepID=UPI000B779688|nr:protein IWS1 homolog 1-like [Chenopodium quinoa]